MILSVLLRRQQEIERSRNLLFSATTVRRLSDSRKNATLVLLRHGESTWNASPTFTGWCDAPLTERGIAQAKAAGELLKSRGFTHFDIAFTSALQRAIVSCELCVQEATSNNLAKSETPVIKAWQLNERHYGALQGMKKNNPKLIEKYGVDQVRKWRRDFTSVPPPMNEYHEHYQPPPAPLTESLKQCQERVIAYWYGRIFPTLKPGTTILIAVHSNVLRALKAYLDSIPVDQIPKIHIPNSVPCIYEFDASGKIIPPHAVKTDHSADVSAATSSTNSMDNTGCFRGRWLFSVENLERLHRGIGPTSAFARAIFEAWDLDGDGQLTKEEIEKGLQDLIDGEHDVAVCATELMGGNDVAVTSIAEKILEEVHKDKNSTLTIEEFEIDALKALRKFLPGLMKD